MPADTCVLVNEARAAPLAQLFREPKSQGARSRVMLIGDRRKRARCFQATRCQHTLVQLMIYVMGDQQTRLTNQR